MRSALQPLVLGAVALATLADSKPIAMPIAPYRLEGMSLKKRAVLEVVCGQYATADIGDNGENRSNLDDKGGSVAVGAGQCSRIGCYDTSAVYVCSDGNEDIEFEMSEVVEQMQYLQSICIGGDSIGKDTVSGGLKVDTHGGWSLAIGYGNCNHPANSRPEQYNDGYPGPNGDPDVVCGGEDEPSCEGGFCAERSVVIESQDTVTCDAYHAGSYVGPGANVVYNTNRQITTTWSIGGFLGIDSSSLRTAAGNSGLFATFSEGTTTGSTAGISAPCGGADVVGNFTCALHIEPQCFEMIGYCTDAATDQRVPWANVMPQVAEDGIGVYYSETCTCGECADADNPGAPDLCELECNVQCPNK